MFIAFSVISSLLFAWLYFEALVSRNASIPQAATVAFGILITYLVAFLAPRPFFRHSNADIAPVVMTRLMTRAALSSAIVVAASAVVALGFGAGDVGLIGELYLFALMAILLFFLLGGALADHVIYLQQTRQYNSNQLVAALLGVTLILLVLILYFLSFDLARGGPAHALARDLMAITLALVGYGWAVFQMAHH